MRVITEDVVARYREKAEALERLLDFVRPRYDRYSLPIPGLLCPQARADGAVCGAPAYVRYEGFCREHMLDAMESCEDILETYREYIVALKKWARLGAPRHLQRVRPFARQDPGGASGR